MKKKTLIILSVAAVVVVAGFVLSNSTNTNLVKFLDQERVN